MRDGRTPEQRLLAALAHAAAVITGPGILVGVLIWLTQREKSAFTAWQAMQAAIYQLIGLILTGILWVGWFLFYAVTFIPIVQHPSQVQDAPPPIFWIGLASVAVPLAFMVLWAIYGLWGALMCWRGKDFRYAILGRRLPALDVSAPQDPSRQD